MYTIYTNTSVEIVLLQNGVMTFLNNKTAREQHRWYWKRFHGRRARSNQNHYHLHDTSPSLDSERSQRAVCARSRWKFSPFRPHTGFNVPKHRRTGLNRIPRENRYFLLSLLMDLVLTQTYFEKKISDSDETKNRRNARRASCHNAQVHYASITCKRLLTHWRTR